MPERLILLAVGAATGALLAGTAVLLLGERAWLPGALWGAVVLGGLLLLGSARRGR